mmetsp:Transcript_22279/g.33166  ORF Transcript_22279/g.33166 Transcript_22279/m.33166 type:complete len:93 (+) Transcript_22279:1745-2023(+)
MMELTKFTITEDRFHSTRIDDDDQHFDSRKGHCRTGLRENARNQEQTTRRPRASTMDMSALVTDRGDDLARRSDYRSKGGLRRRKRRHSMWA